MPAGKHAVHVYPDRIAARFEIDPVPFARHGRAVREPGQSVDGDGYPFAGVLAVDLDLESDLGWSAAVIGALCDAVARLRGIANRDSAVPERIGPLPEMHVAFPEVPHGVQP